MTKVSKKTEQTGAQKFHLKTNTYGDEKNNNSFFLRAPAKDPSLYTIDAGSKPKWEPPSEEHLQVWKKVKSKGTSILGRTLLAEAKDHD